MHGKISIKAYPTVEFGEMAWAYLGPRERLPELPQLECCVVPAGHRFVSKRLQQCNWAQSMEGALSTAHFSFLHMPATAVGRYVDPGTAADENRLRWLRDDPMPRFTIVDHDVGFVVGGARRAEEGQSYWRVTQFMLPGGLPPPRGRRACVVRAPFAQVMKQRFGSETGAVPESTSRADVRH